jgi:phosphocarrier protein
MVSPQTHSWRLVAPNGDASPVVRLSLDNVQEFPGEIAWRDTAPSPTIRIISWSIGARLHARPSLKLTQLAKTFSGSVEIALSPEGPWINAKSPVSVMRVRVPSGSLLYVRTKWVDAAAAVDAIVALVASQFDADHVNTCSSSTDA